MNRQEEEQSRAKCTKCKRTFFDPKTLVCHHSFCKECLDGLLLFKQDGSAIIQCPMKCRKTTHLTQYQTTNSLIPFHQVGTYDVTKEKGLTTCPLCTEPITKYCSTCYIEMCSACCQEHNTCKNDNNIINTRYHQWKQCLKPFCIEHETYSNFYCLQCKQFVCLYCKQRSHKEHNTEKIFTLAYNINKTCKNKKEMIRKEVDVQKYITRKKTVSLNEIKTWRDVLCTELESRKFQRLNEFMVKLTKEEDLLLAEFDHQANTYQDELRTICSQYDHDEELLHKLKAYLSEDDHKSVFQNFLEGTHLVNSVEEKLLLRENNDFPDLCIYLSDIEDFIEENNNILGCLCFETNNVKIKASSDEMDSSVLGIWKNTDINETSLAFADNFKQYPLFMERILNHREEVKKVSSDKKPRRRKQNKKEQKMKHKVDSVNSKVVTSMDDLIKNLRSVDVGVSHKDGIKKKGQKRGNSCSNDQNKEKNIEIVKNNASTKKPQTPQQNYIDYEHVLGVLDCDDIDYDDTDSYEDEFEHDENSTDDEDEFYF